MNSKDVDSWMVDLDKFQLDNIENKALWPACRDAHRALWDLTVVMKDQGK